MKSYCKVGRHTVQSEKLVLYACGIDISLQVYFIYHKTNAALLKDIK